MVGRYLHCRSRCARRNLDQPDIVMRSKSVVLKIGEYFFHAFYPLSASPMMRTPSSISLSEALLKASLMVPSPMPSGIKGCPVTNATLRAMVFSKSLSAETPCGRVIQIKKPPVGCDHEAVCGIYLVRAWSIAPHFSL